MGSSGVSAAARRTSSISISAVVVRDQLRDRLGNDPLRERVVADLVLEHGRQLGQLERVEPQVGGQLSSPGVISTPPAPRWSSSLWIVSRMIVSARTVVSASAKMGSLPSGERGGGYAKSMPDVPDADRPPLKVDLRLTSEGPDDKGGRGYLIRALWLVVNAVVFMNPVLRSFRLKAWILRLFGAEIGEDVVFKQGVSIKYPWFLKVGDHSWIGERVWLDCNAPLDIGKPRGDLARRLSVLRHA